MCSENSLYGSLSSGNTPLVKKVSCGVEFCRVWSPVVRARTGLAQVTKGWNRLRWQCSYRPEWEAALLRAVIRIRKFSSPYLQIYYSDLKLQVPITPKAVMQALFSGSWSWQREGRSCILTKGHRELFSLVLLIPFPEVPQYLSGLYLNKIPTLDPFCLQFILSTP